MDPERVAGRPDLANPALSVVIPVYNEGENIAATLHGLREQLRIPTEVLVVYDFEGDTTIPVVKRLQAEMPWVRLHRNDLGRGALNAVKAGFAAARGPYVLVTMADLSDDPADIEPMLAVARKVDADVVAASRYMVGGRQVGGPFVKRTLSRIAGLSLHYVAGVPTHDPTNNFKLYSRRLLAEVDIESEAGFELALELTVKAHLKGMRIAEVPTTWRDRSSGESRFQMRKWIPHYLRWYRMGMLGRLKRS